MKTPKAASIRDLSIIINCRYPNLPTGDPNRLKGGIGGIGDIICYE